MVELGISRIPVSDLSQRGVVVCWFGVFFPFWLERLYFSPSGMAKGNNMELVVQK